MVMDVFLEILDFRAIPDFDETYAEYEKIIEYKTNLFSLACEKFKEKTDPAYISFCTGNAWCPDDASLFFAIKKYNSHKPWSNGVSS
jgi:4-alpha-glucanotransferase